MTDTEDDSASSDSWPVNEDWLIEMLKQHHSTNNDIKIADFSAKQGCSDGVSNLSDILAVSVTYNISQLPNESASLETVSSSEKLEFIIKLLPHDPFSRYFVTEAKFDLREIRFYTRVLPDLMEFQNNHIKTGCEKMSICVPKCFYTHYSPGKLPPTGSPEPPESILVLEDMRSSGYKVSAELHNNRQPFTWLEHFFSGRKLHQRLESRASWIRHQGHSVGSCAIVGHEVQGEGWLERKVFSELIEHTARNINLRITF